MDKYEKRKKVAEWLNKKGYELELDKDGLWMEDYDFQEHKTKEVIDLMIEFAQDQIQLSDINWILVNDEKPDSERWVLTSNIIDNWVDRAEYNTEEGYWWNGECEIIPTHWAELPKPPHLK